MWKPVLLTVASTMLSLASFSALLIGLQPRAAAASGVSAPIVVPAPSVAASAALVRLADSRPLNGVGPAVSRDSFDYCAAPAAFSPAPGGYDAAFALGAGVAVSRAADLAEVVNDDARLRPLAAYLAVTRLGLAPRLGLAGGRTSGPGAPSEAASMKAFVASREVQAAYANSKPLPPIVLEERSTSTEANLAEIQKIAAASGWRRVLVVTNQYHLPRVRMQTEGLGLAADVVPAETILDQALRDPAVHRQLCARYASAAVGESIQHEMAFVGVLRMLQP